MSEATVEAASSTGVAAAAVPAEQPSKEGDATEQTVKSDAPAEVSATAAENQPANTTESKEDEAAKKDSTTNGKDTTDDKTSTPQKRRREDDDGRRAGHSHKKPRRGNVFDPTVQDITDDPLAIRKQVEFYFSDANLARDKFLFEQVEGSKNTPIDIKVIHSFKRMRRYQPYEAVIKALKESDLLEVTEDEKLKRKTPLPAGFENKSHDEIKQAVDEESLARSVYVKGFGYEKPSTQFDIEAWFSQHGTTNQVRLRRFDDKTFKGSVFVEFDSEETAKDFLALDPKPKYLDQDLKIQSKKEYIDDKAQALKDGIIESDGKGGYRRTEAHRRRGNDDRDWRERREEDRKNGFKRGGGRGGRGRGRGGRGGYERRDRNEERKAAEEASASTESAKDAAPDKEAPTAAQ